MSSARCVILLAPAFAIACGNAHDLDPVRRPSGSNAGGMAGAAGGGTGPIGLSDAATTVPPGTCESPATADSDGDGYTGVDGDCNDCDGAINPGAFDVASNGIDEDCSGSPDDEPASCDDGLPADGNAAAMAKAIGICRTAVPDARGKDRTWGLVSARFVFPDGTTGSLDPEDSMVCGTKGAPPDDQSHGILPRFGPNVKPRQGATLAALSSGIAREGLVDAPDDRGTSPSGASMCAKSRMPDGFPASSYATCGDLEGWVSEADPPDSSVVPPDPTVAYDGIALELVIRAPTNARSFAFDFDFYTYEYNTFVCSEYNDTFVALLTSKSPDVPTDHNIAFDSQKDPVCVNNAFVEVCTPFDYEGTQNGMPFHRSFTCQYGTRELEGTGFGEPDDVHAATGWLSTRSNIVPGEEFTLRFAVWDAGDEILDSTVLIDHFVWDLKPGETVTKRPPDIK
jgi:hypothetical protein